MSLTVSRRRPTALVTLLGMTLLGTLGIDAPADDPTDPPRTAALAPFQLVEDRDVDDRLPQPEDRYALAGGCYTVELPGGFVTRSGDTVSLTDDADAAEPFHFQATELGRYLLATNEGRDTEFEDAWWDVRGYLSASGAPAAVGNLAGVSVVIADEPSPAGDWVVAATGADPDARAEPGTTQTYALVLPDSGQGLASEGGNVALVDADAAAPVAFHHVPDDDALDDDPNGTECANWPEVDLNAEGRPAPADDPAAPVQGFFEAHVHGMAYEFLGGELRCGSPWHRYGVEYALPNCDETNPLQFAADAALGAGAGPEYDGRGWPTFSYWPQPRTLTHEQYYHRWVERAYLGGLRLTTNLLVDNTALCQAYPHRKNSCNEMDSVRLQARRMYELQNYIDAQSGGPGEGWYRIVQTPAQARAAINAGRMAVVMGIEVSELFDCREILDVPQCTADQIDDRLREVYDMGVRQMELINKFDNALAGVTGDGGATGIVVNTGNRYVTQHWWDMQTCEEPNHEHADLGDEHDKHQINVQDDAPDGGNDEIDVLAGMILETYGASSGIIPPGTVAPVYPEGPHCNSRGLTDLGAHLIRRMVELGMIFDPDHMSAAAQRQALDLIESEYPVHAGGATSPGNSAGKGKSDERGKGKTRTRLQPAVISSHSWANDVVYQRIYQLDGVVAPRTDDAHGFVGRWARHKAWFEQHAPEDAPFGLGYGADTNGLGGQPGASPNQPDYVHGFEAPIGGVRLFQQTSGLRTFDAASEGVSHYGLFADWFEQVRLAAEKEAAGRGDEIIADMLDAAEAYLRIWERGTYGANDCVSEQTTLQHEDLHALLGGNLEGFLEAAGQPILRDDAVYTYCVEGEDGSPQVVDVTFTDDGTATGISPSTRAEEVLRSARGSTSG
jgi:microsomal dipeptidase-like Zn-dependent dipeptidase